MDNTYGNITAGSSVNNNSNSSNNPASAMLQQSQLQQQQHRQAIFDAAGLVRLMEAASVLAKFTEQVQQLSQSQAQHHEQSNQVLQSLLSRSFHSSHAKTNTTQVTASTPNNSVASFGYHDPVTNNNSVASFGYHDPATNGGFQSLLLPQQSVVPIVPKTTAVVSPSRALQPNHQAQPLLNGNRDGGVINLFHQSSSSCNTGGNIASIYPGTSSTGKEIFPERLMVMLNECSSNANSEIVTWLPNGTSFVVLRPDTFAETILPKYFPPISSTSEASRNKQQPISKYTSFTRKLNRWGFRQATRGSDTGAFHHPLFRKHEPHLCLEMVCCRRRPQDQQSSTVVANRDSAATSNKDAALATCTKEQSSKDRPSSRNSVQTFLTKEDIGKHDMLSSSLQTSGLLKKKPVPAVSDDGRSISSSSSLPASEEVIEVIGIKPSQLSEMVPLSSAHSNGSGVTTTNAVITRDNELTQAALLKRNETERLRAAKAMLYESYCRAIRGE